VYAVSAFDIITHVYPLERREVNIRQSTKSTSCKTGELLLTVASKRRSQRSPASTLQRPDSFHLVCFFPLSSAMSCEKRKKNYNAIENQKQRLECVA